MPVCLSTRWINDRLQFFSFFPLLFSNFLYVISMLALWNAYSINVRPFYAPIDDITRRKKNRMLRTNVGHTPYHLLFWCNKNNFMLSECSVKNHRKCAFTLCWMDVVKNYVSQNRRGDHTTSKLLNLCIYNFFSFFLSIRNRSSGAKSVRNETGLFFSLRHCIYLYQ